MADRFPSIRFPSTPLCARQLCPVLLLTLAAWSDAFAGWQLQASGTDKHLYDVNAHHGDINVAWACGEDGTILFTSDGGATWTAQVSGTTATLHSVAFMEIGTGPVFVVGEGGTILRTTDQGQSWNPISSGTSSTLRDISDFGFLIVGDDGVVLGSTNQGLTWTVRTSGTTARLNAASASFSRYAVGEAGTMIVSNAAAQDWTPRDLGTELALFGTPMFGATNCIVGETGLILFSTNAGQNWSALPSGTTRDLHAVEFSVNNTSRMYVVGDGGLILKTTNTGQSWGAQSTGTTANLRSVFFYLNDNSGYAVGENGTILKTTDGGGPIVPVGVHEGLASGDDLRFYGYPNPLRFGTTLVYESSERGDATRGEARIEIFDAAGRLASRIAVSPGPGRRAVSWNGVAPSGQALAPGHYFARLAHGGRVATTRLTIVR
jgi:photosystem II stability/assembly factor-like uncharacterized protein